MVLRGTIPKPRQSFVSTSRCRFSNRKCLLGGIVKDAQPVTSRGNSASTTGKRNRNTVWKAIKINLMEIFSLFSIVCLFQLSLEKLWWCLCLTSTSHDSFPLAVRAWSLVEHHLRPLILHNSDFSLKLIFGSFQTEKSFLSERKRAKISSRSLFFFASSRFVYFRNKSKLHNSFWRREWRRNEIYCFSWRTHRRQALKVCERKIVIKINLEAGICWNFTHIVCSARWAFGREINWFKFRPSRASLFITIVGLIAPWKVFPIEKLGFPVKLLRKGG